jgi:hypothetical protein
MTACISTTALRAQQAPDSVRLMHTIGVLADDSMQGRKVGTPGSEKARRFLISELNSRGVKPFAGGVFPHQFKFAPGRRRGGTAAPAGQTPAQVDSITGTNLLGVIGGSKHPNRYIVVSAHYDHLGPGNGDVYNGADDNASGTAGVLEVASYFAAHKPENSIIIALFDAEESGDRGSKAFVTSALMPSKDSVLIDINLDMVGRNVKNELYATGTLANPFLAPYVDAAATRSGLKLLKGHDGAPGTGDNWIHQSDQGAFADDTIPYLYFGEEDHPDYHKPTDEVKGIMPGFYVAAVRTVLDVTKQVDAKPPVAPPPPKN